VSLPSLNAGWASKSKARAGAAPSPSPCRAAASGASRRSFCSVVLLHGRVDAPFATLFRSSVAEIEWVL
jgi:hypothetical protein